MARREAQTYGIRASFKRSAAGASRRATCASFLMRYRAGRYLSAVVRSASVQAHAISRRFRHSGSALSLPSCAQVGRSPVAQDAKTISQLLAGPPIGSGEGPDAARGLHCDEKPASAAPRPANRNASRQRPSEGRGDAEFMGGAEGGDKWPMTKLGDFC